MKYSYYNPNLSIIDFLRASFSSTTDAEKKILEYSRELTGKKYILLTNSCRTALYLAYKSLPNNGEVITTPLTCKVGIDPIVESGNKVVFSDISLQDLNMDPEDIEHRITPATIAIQAIHLGGVSCRMDALKNLAESHKLTLIEDCAQAMGAAFKGRPTGSFGDVACFSHIKNAYGVGGGVLATDSDVIYQKANELNSRFVKGSVKLVAFRIIRNWLESCSNNRITRVLLGVLKAIKGSRKNYHTVERQLRKITRMELKIAAHQISKFNRLHPLRKDIGKQYLDLLTKRNLIINKEYSPEEASFTKFFAFHPSIVSKKHNSQLQEAGIEVMHLEHHQQGTVQERLVAPDLAEKSGLINYNAVHDHLISLPLSENFKDSDIDQIIETFAKIVKS